MLASTVFENGCAAPSVKCSCRSIAPVRASRKYCRYSVNRHLPTPLFLCVPIDFTGDMSCNQHYSTGTLEVERDHHCTRNQIIVSYLENRLPYPRRVCAEREALVDVKFLHCPNQAEKAPNVMRTGVVSISRRFRSSRVFFLSLFGPVLCSCIVMWGEPRPGGDGRLRDGLRGRQASADARGAYFVLSKC